MSDHSLSSIRRVFILGAGVSASCGIAVAKDILRESILGLTTRRAKRAEAVHKLLKYFYPAFNETLRNYPNIEDFLNLIEMGKKFNSEEFIASKLWSEPRLQEVSDITPKAVTDYLWSSMANKKEQQLVQDFVKENLRPGDTLITFNWDLTVERALEDYRGDPGFLYTYSRRRKSDQFSLL